MGFFNRKKSAEPKQKKALWFRILKWSGISFLFLIIIAILLPILFKSQIVNYIKAEANKNLNATLDFDTDDVELSFLSTFPNFTLSVPNLSLEGKDEFKGLKLADIKKLTVKFNLWSVMGGDQYEVKEIHLDQPKIYVKVTEDGKANYDIAIPDSTKKEPEEPSTFKLALKKYTIKDGMFVYDDLYYKTYMKLEDIQHKGSGDITASVYDLITKTTAKGVTLAYDGTKYINEVDLDLDATLGIDMTKDMKFTFKKNKIKMNDLQFHADGAFVMKEEGYLFDKIALSADKNGLKSFLSMIPSEYLSDMSGVKTDGKMDFHGSVNGMYTETVMPGFDFTFNIENGMIQYPGMPSNISNLNVKSQISMPEGSNMDLLTIKIPTVGANFAGSKIEQSSHFNLSNPMTDPNIDTKILANINLAELEKVIPMAEGESYAGKISSDIYFKGRMSKIENENYVEVNAGGHIQANDLVYKAGSEAAPIEISRMLAELSPQFLSLSEFDLKWGESDMTMTGKVDNYLAYYLKGENLHGSFDMHSSYLNMDAFMSDDSAYESSNPDEKMVSSDTSAGAILVPKNIDFQLNSTIDKMMYDGLEISDVLGQIHVKDGIAELNNLQLKALGGGIRLNGKYDTQNEKKPKMAMGFDLSNIEISETLKFFPSIAVLAPIAKSAQGFINSNFSMNTDLTSSMMPVYNTLTGGGDMSSKSVYVEGFEPVNKLASDLNVERLSKQTIENVKMKFAFKDGKVFVNPFKVNLGGIKTDVSGSTSFEQDIDYKLGMLFPKKDLPKSAIEAAEKAIGKAGEFGLDIGALPNEIPINVLMTGKVNDPTIKTDLQEQLLALTGNLTDQIKDKLKEEAEELIDSAKQVVEDKIDEVKDDLTERRDKVLADAQVQADKVKAEGKKAADKIRAEADKAYDEALAQAKNPLEKKVIEKTASAAKVKAYEKADKVEKEANDKADKIMSDARDKANKLE
jgi:hypothetical protein